jgi:tetratricopeptide (TPR) repeat protein
MILRIICLYFLLSASIILMAQDNYTQFQNQRVSSLSFQHSNRSLNNNTNSILIRLAAALDESPRSLSIDVAYTEVLDVDAPPMKSPEVTIRMKDVHVLSAPTYRGFPMNEVLTPDLVSCYLNLIDLPDSNVLRQYNLNNLAISQLARGYISKDIPVILPGRFSVTLSDIIFHFSDTGIKNFREMIMLINDYYAAAALTDSLLEVTNTYIPLLTGDLPEKYLMLMEINRVVRLISDYKFHLQLPLDKNDPAHFTEKFLRLDKFSRSATMTLEQQLADPSPINWTESLDDLSETYILHLISYIRKSMLIKGARGGLYKDYLDSWFLTSGFKEEEETFYRLVKKMFPVEEPDVLLHWIAQNVWDAYLKGARSLIEKSDYVGAIILLEHATAFRENVPVEVEPSYQDIQAEAVKGIYASYLGIAESCIDLQKFEMADEYISHAGRYLAEYKSVIPVDTMFQRVFRKLFDRRLQGCDYILEHGNYKEALDCYQLFSLSYPPEMISYVDDHVMSRETEALKGLFFNEIDHVESLVYQRLIDSALVRFDIACRYSDLIDGDPEAEKARKELDNKMLPIRYQQLADRGTYLYMTYNHEQAYTTFNRMKEVGKLLEIPLDTALERMYTESYKYHMLNEISMATGMIWKNELEMAKDYIREVESVMDLYNLEMDPDLQSALNSYRRKIDLKVCLGVKEEADMLSLRAYRNIELKQFDIALIQLGDARKRVLQHPECEIDIRAYNDTIKKYLSAAFYIEKQKEALNQLTIGNFSEAMKRVSDNERFYVNTELEQFGVPFVSALDFVAQSARVPMYIEAITFFLQNGKENSAWVCLTWLKREGMEARDVRYLQESVGRALATRDFNVFPNGDPENRIRSYTGGNRWFVKFAQTYDRRWRQLQTEQSQKTP